MRRNDVEPIASPGLRYGADTGSTTHDAAPTARARALPGATTVARLLSAISWGLDTGRLEGLHLAPATIGCRTVIFVCPLPFDTGNSQSKRHFIRRRARPQQALTEKSVDLPSTCLRVTAPRQALPLISTNAEGSAYAVSSPKRRSLRYPLCPIFSENLSEQPRRKAPAHPGPRANRLLSPSTFASPTERSRTPKSCAACRDAPRKNAKRFSICGRGKPCPLKVTSALSLRQEGAFSRRAGPAKAQSPLGDPWQEARLCSSVSEPRSFLAHSFSRNACAKSCATLPFSSKIMNQ